MAPGRGRGRGSNGAQPPRGGRSRSSCGLPSHTNQIMDEFLLNNKPHANKYEQIHQLETQSAILSSLRRQQNVPGTSRLASASTPAPVQQQKQQFHQEEQPLVDPRPPPSQHLGGVPSNSKSENDKYASSWNAMESQLHSLQPHQHNHDQNTNPHNLQYRGGAANNEQLRHRPNRQQGQGSTKLEIDEDNDIVCCDGEPCHEGTKNLCTIGLWALIVFGIMNRFFVHMAMHLHNKGADGSVSLKEHDASFNSLQDNSMQDVQGGNGVYMVGQE